MSSINYDIEQSVEAVRAILAAERLRRSRLTGVKDFVQDAAGRALARDRCCGDSALAMRQKSPTASSSARALGSMPSPSSRASLSGVICRSDERSILRLWPKAAAVTFSSAEISQGGLRRLARHELDQSGIDLGPRREGAAGKREQDARRGAPLRKHGKPPVILAAGRRRRCVRRPRAGTSARAGRTKAARARSSARR